MTRVEAEEKEGKIKAVKVIKVGRKEREGDLEGGIKEEEEDKLSLTRS